VFETFAAVMMLIIFLVPGFVWKSMEGQFAYQDRRLEWQKYALGLLACSTVVYLPYAALLYKIWIIRRYIGNFSCGLVAAFLLLLVLPSLLGYLTGRSRQHQLFVRFFRWLNIETFNQHYVPTAWDALFNHVSPCWVIVTLKNGKLIRGYLGRPSHISSDPEVRDLYISHLIQPDNSGLVKNTKGIYIKADEVSTIELISKEPDHE
jgi:hypothetical protein